MNTKRVVAAFAGAALVVLGSASGAFADYAAPNINLSVTPTELTGGETFTGVATSDAPCDWSITYAGPTSTSQPITGSGTELDFSFTTTEVDAQTTDAVTASCSYDDGTPGEPRASVMQEVHTSVDVTVDPAVVSAPGSGTGTSTGVSGSGLPDTGGPSGWLAVVGAALTLLGAGAVIRSRRPTRA